MQASQMSVIARLYQLSLELCHQAHHVQAAPKDQKHQAPQISNRILRTTRGADFADLQNG